MKRPPFPEDSGLAIERTVLAWGRTAMGLVGLAALLVRFGEREHVEVVAYAVAAFVVIAGAASWAVSRNAYHHARLPFLSRNQHRAFALSVCAASVGTAVTVLLGLG